jgi:hypothetical protein
MFLFIDLKVWRGEVRRSFYQQHGVQCLFLAMGESCAEFAFRERALGLVKAVRFREVEFLRLG